MKTIEEKATESLGRRYIYIYIKMEQRDCDPNDRTQQLGEGQTSEYIHWMPTAEEFD